METAEVRRRQSEVEGRWVGDVCPRVPAVILTLREAERGDTSQIRCTNARSKDGKLFFDMFIDFWGILDSSCHTFRWTSCWSCHVLFLCNPIIDI